jgi:hypothetical protein
MGEENKGRVFNIQPVAFLVAQAFTVTTVYRDRMLKQSPVIHIDKPTLIYSGQSIGFFVVAVGCVVFNLIATAEWPGFYGVCALWVLVSSLAFSKDMRDRNYADVFTHVNPEDQHECYPKLAQLVNASIEYQVFVWLTGAFGVLNFLGVVWTWDESIMDVKDKGFFTLVAIWCEASTFRLAMMIRDWNDENRRRWMQEQMAFQVIIGLGCLVGHGVCILVISFHDIRDWQRLLLFSAWGNSITTLFLVARLVRDRMEVQQLGLLNPDSQDYHEQYPSAMPPPSPVYDERGNPVGYYPHASNHQNMPAPVGNTFSSQVQYQPSTPQTVQNGQARHNAPYYDNYGQQHMQNVVAERSMEQYPSSYGYNQYS